MNEELKDILGNSNKDIDNQKLMDYLSKQLSKQEIHDVEKMMAEDEFMNDAIEGLEEFKAKEEMPSYIVQLNQKLSNHIKHKKRKKEKKKIQEEPWVYFTIILILILMAVSYVLIKKYLDHEHRQIKTSSSHTI